ncbi:MAG: PP2C family protein-serine/threonine phosphatase [Bryobacteraceae bacterium]|jgi:serine phosphatase RsbU (regulator of sigma subunit)/predicted enzyme related to lactoylglutathione lyase
MSSSHSPYKAHRCSFQPDREDPYLRLSTVPIFVRDQSRSLQFYLDQLGFYLAFDTRLPSGDRWLTVTPPDGTANLALIAPAPGSEEYKLIGRSPQLVFLTDDVSAKFHEWRKRGVRFNKPPQVEPSGATSSTFEDVDGNSFTLLSLAELTEEIGEQRRAHAEKLESERRAAQELETAREVQARLFPQRQPNFAGLDYTGVCIQARHVGGDYYDFIDLGRERLGLVIGDICGKGTAAALLMANLQAHLHNQCATYWSRPFTPFALEQPQRFLVSVNRLFRENTIDSAYATLFFAEYDAGTRRIRYANCGHPSAILLRHNNECERLDSTSTVLGLFKEWDCAVAERELFPGDTLALYTDGLTEAFNAEGEEFGEERVVEALQRRRDLSSKALLASLVDDVRQFSPHEQQDDITLVVARCSAD